MGTPKQRRTKSARNQRRSHHSLKSLILVKCGKCGKPAKPHHICRECGYYNSKKLIDVSEKLPKKRGESDKKIKERRKKSEKEKAGTENKVKK